MSKKLYQVTDNIHDTIYLSSLESELISTPYFYRLHDIYQSSTVYMIFPSNRTKRYEHSMGTMELASSMLYSAVSNAESDTRNRLFNQLNMHYSEILNLAIKKAKKQNVPYFINCQKYIEELIKVGHNKDAKQYVEECINNGLEERGFSDTALDYYQFYSMNINNEKGNSSESLKNMFLYRCLLQAVRIVALFHDVGHPPYSHILEDVIVNLFNEFATKEGETAWQRQQLDDFKECLKGFVTKKESDAYVCRTLYSDISYVEQPFHERVGLYLFELAISEVVPKIMERITQSEKSKNYKITNCIYYIMVIEFAIAMLAEEYMLFKSIHKIVDADRLDYIMRDSLNSGVDWGRIPYKRVINSANYFVCQNTMVKIYKKMKDRL